LHIIDVSGASGRDPVHDYQVIRKELELYRADLAAKPEIVAANKIDALDEPERLEQLREFCSKQGMELYPISAATGEGLKPLIGALARALESFEQQNDRSLVATKEK
jgi:GTP-binding protein